MKAILYDNAKNPEGKIVPQINQKVLMVNWANQREPIKKERHPLKMKSLSKCVK